MNPKIPTCSQLEEVNEKQLSVEQTHESRLVTKVKIEFILFEIKNSKKLFTTHAFINFACIISSHTLNLFFMNSVYSTIFYP